MSTTINHNIMMMVSDLIEEMLKSDGIAYLRNKTEFSVAPENIQRLLHYQGVANKILIAQGIITKEMLENDIKKNFSHESIDETIQ